MAQRRVGYDPSIRGESGRFCTTMQQDLDTSMQQDLDNTAAGLTEQITGLGKGYGLLTHHKTLLRGAVKGCEQDGTHAHDADSHD